MLAVVALGADFGQVGHETADGHRRLMGQPRLVLAGKEVGGPAFVKAIKGPCPWTSIMPSGGVSPDKENLEAWFNAGVTCVGLGSQLTPNDVIKNGDFKFIENTTLNTLHLSQKYKLINK